jgi:hypothetical protein
MRHRSNLLGTWDAARAAASGAGLGAARTGGSEPVDLIGHTGDLCAQSAEIVRKISQSDDVLRRHNSGELQGLSE